jgi:primosomal protein N'
MYVDVILPLPLANTYTYLLPEEFSGDVKMGARVIVPFGKSKIYTALVYNIHFLAPENVELKSVISVLDGESIVRPGQLRFWEWLSNYYQCTLGEIFKAALPSGLKLESETIISLVEDFEAEYDALVYLVVRSYTEMGVLDSYFYVSDHKEEWDMDYDDLSDGYAMVYVYNQDEPAFSEFGSIGWREAGGGIVRTA